MVDWAGVAQTQTWRLLRFGFRFLDRVTASAQTADGRSFQVKITSYAGDPSPHGGRLNKVHTLTMIANAISAP